MNPGMPSTTVDPRSFVPSTTVHSDAPLSEIDVASIVTLALARSGMSNKAAAAAMKLDTAQWSRQLHGNDAHVSLQRLVKLPAAFWLELIPMLAAPLGFVVAHPDMAQVTLGRVMELAGEIARFVAQQQTLRRVG